MNRGIKTFVLRGGRISNKQKYALEHILPNYLIPKVSGFWSYSDFFPQNNQTIVEIGFGMGDALIANARQNPDLNFIGIDVFEPGIANLTIGIKELDLKNVRIAPYDAVEVFDSNIQNDSLFGIQIFFPDPWPKKKHHKRRIIQSDFVAKLAGKIKPDGFIHTATDWEDYANHIDDVFSKEPLLYNLNSQSLSLPIFNRPTTKFERRGQLLGHKIWDFIYSSN